MLSSRLRENLKYLKVKFFAHISVILLATLTDKTLSLPLSSRRVIVTIIPFPFFPNDSLLVKQLMRL